MTYFSWHKEQEPNVVRLQRKQHVLEKEMLQQRKQKDVHQQKDVQQQKNVLELQRENARTYSFF